MPDEAPVTRAKGTGALGHGEISGEKCCDGSTPKTQGMDQAIFKKPGAEVCQTVPPLQTRQGERVRLNLRLFRYSAGRKELQVWKTCAIVEAIGIQQIKRRQDGIVRSRLHA